MNRIVTGTDIDPRWQSIVDRDASVDGTFVYSVKTTGVYCRPSCPSRAANPSNVSFHLSCDEAEKAGFRACLRCHPDRLSKSETKAALVERACRLIENADDRLSLGDLARTMGMSASHFHRLFKATTGVTPRGYAMARRKARIRDHLSVSNGTVTEAIFDAGYNSSSRFYETSNEVLGMTPTAFRQGGKNSDIRFAIGQCSLGAVLVACSDKGICAITLGDDPDALARDVQDRFPNANLIGGDADFERVVADVIGFVETPGTGFALPLDIRGTAFQQRVWQVLREVPAGQTVSYTDVAERIGAPKAVRAVAQACGANKIAVVIPCHRVVRNDGALSGYRWGVERKRALLDKERNAPSEQ